MDEKSRYEYFNEITFEAYCKRAIDRAILKARQRQAARAKREISLSELPENALYDVRTGNWSGPRPNAAFSMCGA